MNSAYHVSLSEDLIMGQMLLQMLLQIRLQKNGYFLIYFEGSVSRELVGVCACGKRVCTCSKRVCNQDPFHILESTEVDTKSPAPAKAQPYTLAGAGLLVSTSVA